MKVYTLYNNFETIGGAQFIALNLATLLSNDNTPIVLTNTPIHKINNAYKKYNVIFRKFSIYNIFQIKRKDIVLCHGRQLTSIYTVLSYLLLKYKKVIYVAHSTFTDKKYISFYPKKIVAISSGVYENLVSYFKIRENRITLIHNGLSDCYSHYYKNINNDSVTIKILYPASINKVKKQIELVNALKNKINTNIQIDFAGEGQLMHELINAIGDSNQFKILGNIDIFSNFFDYDYVCLFSKNEGLPTVLIEGCMFYKPLLTNNIKSVLDLNIDNYNGFVTSDYEGLVKVINNLPYRNSDEYKRLSMNSRIHYEKYFTSNKMIENYKNIITNL